MAKYFADFVANFHSYYHDLLQNFASTHLKIDGSKQSCQIVSTTKLVYTLAIGVSDAVRGKSTSESLFICFAHAQF